MRRRRFFAISAGAIALTGGGLAYWDQTILKRVAVVEPGLILRGAWPKPAPLLRLIHESSIKTIVTLTAINSDDPKYVAQNRVITQTGVNWIIVPMRGSTATIHQMKQAADLIAVPENQPVFFHCVGGHHRSNLVHAAYLIAKRNLSANAAWSSVSALPWSRPQADEADRRRIVEFAASFRHNHEARTDVA